MKPWTWAEIEFVLSSAKNHDEYKAFSIALGLAPVPAHLSPDYLANKEAHVRLRTLMRETL